MSLATQPKAVLRKVKKRAPGTAKENKVNSNKGGKGEEQLVFTTGTRSVIESTESNEVKSNNTTLNDPAIVAAGAPRRQPLSKRASVTNTDGVAMSTESVKTDGGKSEGNKVKPIRTSKASMGEKHQQATAPKISRSARKGRISQSHKPSTKTSSDIEESFSGPKATPRKERSTFPTAATPPHRSQGSTSKRGGAVNKANESMDSDLSLSEDKARSVRFQTDSPPSLETKQGGGNKLHEVQGKALSQEAIAQQFALHDAAALLAHSALPGFANPLYANLITTNLAQQQLATAQVLANLRASVGGFKPLKNFEPASAYDANQVPCLADREDINTTTNIYVNNLPSHTTDDDLLRLGSCFGPVKSHKAIINQETGLCKGYGFIMYEHALDAETALQQLPLHGLTTSWAKESFSTKLRKLSDNTSTNVYVSNLPMDMTPQQLELLFTPHVVVSLRILLDDNGDSRGVGFVRLRDRDTAQDCIDKLHGKILAGQATPLQARFADSEAQKRLKQSINQASPTLSQKPTVNSKTNNGLLDGSGLADSMYLASLQGLHNWAGFGTPQNNSASSFPVVSPSLGMTSPGLNYTQWSPSMAANAAANWNLLTSDVYGNSLLGSSTANYGLNYSNSLYSPSSIATSMNSPFAQMSNKSLSPLSFTSTPLSGTSPMLGKSERSSSNTRSKPTYLPPDVHQQHAKALLEAQGNLAFDSPQAEAFGLSQMLLNVSTGGDVYRQAPNQVSPYSSAHSYVTNVSQTLPGHGDSVMGNALGMSGMTCKGDNTPPSLYLKPSLTLTPKSKNVAPFPSPNTINSTNLNSVKGGEVFVPTKAAAVTLSPIRFSLSKDPENPIAIEALEQDVCSQDNAKMPMRVSTPMPGSMADKAAILTAAANGGIQKQDSVTEEGDSLVIDSGTASAVGKFSLQREEQREDEVATLSKSDSGKIVDLDCHRTDQVGEKKSSHFYSTSMVSDLISEERGEDAIKGSLT